MRKVARSNRPGSDEGDGVATQTEDPLDAEIDEFLGSRGKLPISGANAP